MFSYYGPKSKIVSLYLKPRYNLVIESFAGCAWYSLLYSNFHFSLASSSISDNLLIVASLTINIINYG